MTQRSLFWEGAGGDGGAYGQLHWQDQFFRSILGAYGDRGVARGWRGELQVSGVQSPVSIASGGALVYGMFYDSDSGTTISIPTPSAGSSRYDRIVARRTWDVQTVRVARVAGVAGPTPVIPALTQNPLTIWEIPLATILVNDAGALTVTDDRQFCGLPTQWPANVVTAGAYGPGIITPDKRPDRARYQAKGGNAIRPDSGAPCTRTAGGSYDYWSFADAAFNRAWAFFMVPTFVFGSLDFAVWSIPNVNGAGGGAENCQWDYSIYYGGDGAVPTNATGSANVDQQARLNTTFYRDAVATAIPAIEGQVVAIRLSRDGAADSYNSAMRMLAIEMAWTGDV